MCIIKSNWYSYWLILSHYCNWLEYLIVRKKCPSSVRAYNSLKVLGYVDQWILTSPASLSLEGRTLKHLLSLYSTLQQGSKNSLKVQWCLHLLHKRLCPRGPHPQPRCLTKIKTIISCNGRPSYCNHVNLEYPVKKKLRTPQFKPLICL